MTDPEIATWWKLMAERYGQRWIREHGPEPLTSWRVELSRLSMDDVERGMSALPDRRDSRGQPSTFPPALDEWIALCRPPPSRPHATMYLPAQGRKESPADAKERIARGVILKRPVDVMRAEMKEARDVIAKNRPRARGLKGFQKELARIKIEEQEAYLAGVNGYPYASVYGLAQHTHDGWWRGHCAHAEQIARTWSET